MFKRQTSGSVVCPSCGRLVGVQEPACPHCGRKNPGMFGFGRFVQGLGQSFGLTQVIMAGCIILYLVSLALDPTHVVWFQGFSSLQPGVMGVRSLGASGSVPVFGLGWWWTIFSASWLHGSLLHILFNMLWVRQLAPATERLFGPGRMMLIYLVSGAAGFALSTVFGSPLTLGASAAIFGLLGALVRYGRRTGSNAIGRQAWTWAGMLFIFGLLMPGIDNFAHFGGFVGGYLIAVWLDPLKPEKTDHLVGALIGLLVSAMAVGASLFSSFFAGS